MSSRAHLSESTLPLFAADAVPIQPSYIKDHRKRLRDRFLNGGPDAVPDYEMLELVLFRAIPRRDVKPLARSLIDTFGDFSHVVAADPNRLREVIGVGESVILELKLIEASAQRFAQGKVLAQPILSSWQALLDYCQTKLAHLTVEQVRVLYLDRKNRLVADESQGQGTVGHVPLYPREVLKRALELNASALILVHNHPSGDPTPSEQDISLTHEIAQGAGALGISVHDHLVIGKSTHVSFRDEGLL